jgi:hypothetical protein
MITPFPKRLVLPIAIFFLLTVLFSRKWQPRYTSPPETLPGPIRIPINHPFPNKSHAPDPQGTKYESPKLNEIPVEELPGSISTVKLPVALHEFTKCPREPNRFTGHIRLPNLVYNISMNPPATSSEEKRVFWNPTIIALPFWAKNQYLIVSMVSLSGVAYRRNILCEANICYPESQKRSQARQRVCSKEDIEVLGPNGGMRVRVSLKDIGGIC